MNKKLRSHYLCHTHDDPGFYTAVAVHCCDPGSTACGTYPTMWTLHSKSWCVPCVPQSLLASWIDLSGSQGENWKFLDYSFNMFQQESPAPLDIASVIIRIHLPLENTGRRKGELQVHILSAIARNGCFYHGLWLQTKHWKHFAMILRSDPRSPRCSWDVPAPGWR